MGPASARLGRHRRDIRHQPTLRAAVSAQFQLSRPADSQVIAPHHRLHPNLVPSQGRTPGCASRRRTRPRPTRSQFGPLRTSVMSNPDYRNHPALARKLQAYPRWRNAQGSLPRHAGRPAPRARPHPQRTPATLGPPKTQGCLTNPVNVRGQRTSRAPVQLGRPRCRAPAESAARTPDTDAGPDNRRKPPSPPHLLQDLAADETGRNRSGSIDRQAASIRQFLSVNHAIPALPR